MYRVKTSVRVAWFIVIAGAVLFAFWYAYRANTEREPQEVKQEAQTEQEYNTYDNLDERQKEWCYAHPDQCKG